MGLKTLDVGNFKKITGELMENTENKDTTENTFSATDEQPILVTEAAVTAAKNAIKEDGEEGDGLRVSVIGGGCSGLTYNLDFEKSERIGDTVLEFDGLKIFIDMASAQHLKGTTIDFVSGLQGTGFKFNNPNAVRTCGCGHSFS